MKKQLLKTMLLFFALIAGSSISWADTSTLTPTSAKIAPADDHFTVTYGGTGSSTAWNSSNSCLRIYAKNAITFTAKNSEKITQITFTGTVNANSKGKYPDTMSASVGTITPSTISETGETNFSWTYATGTDEVTLTVGGTAGNIDLTGGSFVVTYTAGAAVSVTGISVDPTEWTMTVGDKKELTATVTPDNATNKNVTWSSNKESVATVDEDGVVTAVSPGTATITVTTKDGGFTASCDVTVTPKPVVSVTFDFDKNDFGFPEGSSKKTTTAANYSYGGYTINLGGGGDGNGYYGHTSGYLLLGKTGCSLTFPAFGFNVSKIKVYGTSGASTGVKQNIFVGETAVSNETTGAKNVTNEYEIEEAYQAAGNVYVLKVTSNANTQISKIEIVGYLNTPDVTAAGWASYVTEKAMRFDEGEAFAVTAAGSGSVTLTEVTDVPKYFPVLLKGAGAKKGYVLEESPAAPANLLAISTGGEINGYVLANKTEGVGFYKWAGGSLTSGKVYLPASAVAGAPDFLGFDGETTSISTTNFTNDTNNSGEFYNLAGQRVANPTKGLYIVNGKKVIIK